MANLLQELEWKLKRVVEKKMSENYLSRETCEIQVYEDFAVWLVNKFQEEVK